MERNDPCWCGSGKKYKKCHMPIEENCTGTEGKLYLPESF